MSKHLFSAWESILRRVYDTGQLNSRECNLHLQIVRHSVLIWGWTIQNTRKCQLQLAANMQVSGSGTPTGAVLQQFLYFAGIKSELHQASLTYGLDSLQWWKCTFLCENWTGRKTYCYCNWSRYVQSADMNCKITAAEHASLLHWMRISNALSVKAQECEISYQSMISRDTKLWWSTLWHDLCWNYSWKSTKAC